MTGGETEKLRDLYDTCRCVGRDLLTNLYVFELGDGTVYVRHVFEDVLHIYSAHGFHYV